MIRACIFDLDGTLIRLPVKYDVIRSELKSLFRTDDDFFRLIPSIVNHAGDSNELAVRSFEIICEEELRAIDGLEVIDGTVDLLNHLKSQGIKLSLVTLQCRRAAERIMDMIGIRKLFSNVLTRDESHDRFDQITKTLKSLGLSPEEVVVIGDRLNDVESAGKARCRSILVGRSTPNPAGNTSHTVKNLSDLRQIDITEF